MPEEARPERVPVPLEGRGGQPAERSPEPAHAPENRKRGAAKRKRRKKRRRRRSRRRKGVTRRRRRRKGRSRKKGVC